jgi:hypothetical protein
MAGHHADEVVTLAQAGTAQPATTQTRVSAQLMTIGPTHTSSGAMQSGSWKSRTAAGLARASFLLDVTRDRVRNVWNSAARGRPLL